MGGAFHADQDGGLNTYPAVNTFTAISAEAGLDGTANNQAYGATEAMFNIYNGSRSSERGRRVIIPRKLELTARQANTNGTDFRFHFYRDTANRWSANGTQLTPYPSSGSEDGDFTHIGSDAVIHAGDLDLSAAGSLERVLWRSWALNVVFVAGDKVTIVWGGDGEIPVAPDPEFFVVHVPSMWIGPGYNLSIHDVATAQTDDPKFMYNFWYEEIDTPT